jgi:DNA mismatch repair protein MutS
MAGKSTLMRQVALIVVLAQMGSFVPAKKARNGIVERLLSPGGATDAVARGESTFMDEMRETATILKNATRRSLVILDEIGRGTSTYDGLAIAWAVAEHLAEVTRCRALFATHYHELTELANTSPGVANVSVAAREHGDDIVFLHALTRGPASRSYGIAVARLAGVPENVSARAQAILASLEGDAREGPRSSPSAQWKSKKHEPTPQLDLFGAPRDTANVAEERALATLKSVDIDRLTPLEALTLLATLKRSL